MKKETLEKIFKKNFTKINLYGNSKDVQFNDTSIPKKNIIIEEDCIIVTYPRTKKYIDIDSIKFIEILNSNGAWD